MSRSVLIPSTQKDCKGHAVGHSNISNIHTYIGTQGSLTVRLNKFCFQNNTTK